MISVNPAIKNDYGTDPCNDKMIMLALSFSEDIGDQGHASSLDVGHHTNS